jgi:hypothetical protein
MISSIFAFPRDNSDTAYPTFRDSFNLTGLPQLPLQDLTGFIIKDGNFPVVRGGFGDVWKCTYHMNQKPINVRSECCFYPLD